MTNRLATTQQPRARPTEDDPNDLVLTLALAWSVHEPARTGQVAFLARHTASTLGRSGTLQWGHHRPQGFALGPELTDPALSREHLAFGPTQGRQVEVVREGRLPLLVNGKRTDRATLRPGDVLEISEQLVCLVHTRPRHLPGPSANHPFGQPDQHGIVGESWATASLREQLAFVAPRQGHVLVQGPSGAGKELVGNAIHAGSSRHLGPVISRSASTIPDSLADAELFGNVRNYPNPGMPERSGLIGAAHQGTLLLDEFGQLPEASQARLLRVLDAGEFSRLGDAAPRRADIRLVAMTNQPTSAIKHDVLARIPHRLMVPGLTARPEDIPLLVLHLLRRIQRTDPSATTAMFDDQGTPRFSPGWMGQLLRRDYATHTRELDFLLWQRIKEVNHGVLDGPTAPEPDSTLAEVDPASLTEEQVRHALDAHGGRRDATWQALGLRSRHQLTRLLKKFGIH